MSYVPPRSPVPLLQEYYWPDAWKCMVICILLNCTQRKQVEPVIERFFAMHPSAADYCTYYPQEECKVRIVELIKPLGFYNRRAERIFKFSMDYLYNFKAVKEGRLDIRRLYGVGEYAARCYEMLFLGKLGDEPPDDHALTSYWEWITGDKRRGDPDGVR